MVYAICFKCKRAYKEAKREFSCSFDPIHAFKVLYTKVILMHGFMFRKAIDWKRACFTFKAQVFLKKMKQVENWVSKNLGKWKNGRKNCRNFDFCSKSGLKSCHKLAGYLAGLTGEGNNNFWSYCLISDRKSGQICNIKKIIYLSRIRPPIWLDSGQYCEQRGIRARIPHFPPYFLLQPSHTLTP